MSQVLGVVPELNERQTHRATLEEALTNIREAIERFLETLPDEQRAAALSREALITAIEVQVYSLYAG